VLSEKTSFGEINKSISLTILKGEKTIRKNFYLGT
jgi:hypothetical protein